ncbi:MAG: argininosuccinate lyase [Nitrospirae bacterium]|nr:argininosuccinate lyase [Nitrospirota bacterium]
MFMKKLWAGRFKEATEAVVEQFTSSLHFDVRLWRYDIGGSIAHVKMLGKQKILSAKDTATILKGLNSVREDIESGRLKFKSTFEDVHMNIEDALTRKVGPVGGKLHTARSRNDQVALDLRLFLRDEIKEIIVLVKGLQKSLVSVAGKHVKTLMPGYTHLQKAQPVLLSHHLLAYYEMLERDRARLEECYARVNVLPLGSAALAGTTLPIDRRYVARLLKFPKISENSMDAVSDRDFVIEFISAASIVMVHLSRFAEEIVLWNSDEFSFVTLPDAFSTGSSIMPQKKNPDILELIRGRSGRVFGDLIAILTVMKGLPLAYNRDMQEDKEPLFDTVDTVKSCLNILAVLLPKIIFNKKAMEKGTEGGYLTATDIAEYLVKKGMPFREAHGVTGRLIRHCVEDGKKIDELELAELKDFSKLIGNDIFSYITVASSVANKISHGGTSGKNVSLRLRNIKGSKKK